MFTEAELELIADALVGYIAEIVNDGAYYSEIAELEGLQAKVTRLIDLGE